MDDFQYLKHLLKFLYLYCQWQSAHSLATVSIRYKILKEFLGT